eukprot:gene24292-29367_t
MPTAKQFCDQGLQLPPEERMAMVDQILDTLEERDDSLDAQWAQEAESRLSAYRRGEGRLAEVLVLDQFSRNVYRDTPQAFAQDALALALAQELVPIPTASLLLMLDGQDAQL